MSQIISLGTGGGGGGGSFVEVQTTDATPTTLFSYALSTDSAVTIAVEVIAAQDDYSHAFSGTIVTGGRRAGGGAVELGIPIVDRNDDFDGTVLLLSSVAGNDVLVTVTGMAGRTINWKGIVTTVVLP